MKHPTLTQSSVVFNEEQHTYTLDGKQLSGITSIIKKYVFPDMYKNVSQAVLNNAAERGTRVHNTIQLWTMGCLSQDELDELKPFFAAYEAAGLDGYVSEYLVSDNESVASSIDLVCFDKDENLVLCDIKTTSVLHVEYLRWQLSIYAYLFELQNPFDHVHGLKAIHIRQDKTDIVDIERLPDEYVVALLDAYRNGAESFDNPLHVIPEGLDNLLKEYAENDESLSYINMVKNEYDKRKDELQAKIVETMSKDKLSKIDTPIAKVTISADSQRESFDLKSFRESAQYAEHPDMFKEFIKTTTTKGRVTITIK